MCGKTLRGRQTRHSFTHRHYTTPAALAGEEGGVRETEQRNFSVWRDKDGGGVVREMWVHLPLP